jgi:hypothetical protein
MPQWVDHSIISGLSTRPRQAKQAGSDNRSTKERSRDRGYRRTRPSQGPDKLVHCIYARLLGLGFRSSLSVTNE